VASERGCHISTIVQNPMNGLLKFHA